MEETKTYCDFVKNMDKDDVDKIYHDHEYGFPIYDDNELFGRLLLEINQAGLSWNTILKKKDNFRKAYSNYDIKTISNYSDIDRERLLNDSGIIRNKLKINAAIHNAKVIIGLQSEFGSIYNWLESYHPLSKEEWIKLFKKTFKFTGGEITNEFLMSIGFLKGAHIETCPVYKEIEKLNPKWMS